MQHRHSHCSHPSFSAASYRTALQCISNERLPCGTVPSGSGPAHRSTTPASTRNAEPNASARDLAPASRRWDVSLSLASDPIDKEQTIPLPLLISSCRALGHRGGVRGARADLAIRATGDRDSPRGRGGPRWARMYCIYPAPPPLCPHLRPILTSSLRQFTESTFPAHRRARHPGVTAVSSISRNSIVPHYLTQHPHARLLSLHLCPERLLFKARQW